MIDDEARHIIEALRSGVPSRAVGQYFSNARRSIIEHIQKKLDETRESKIPGGMVVTGRYGEGKTHLLNTVLNLAHSCNMAVSFISLSKETPFNRLDLVYQKLLHSTYLPKRLQPGFEHLLWDITFNHPVAADMLAFTAKQLQTDKLFYVLRSFFRTDDMDEKYRLLADLEGDFIGINLLKQIHKRIFEEKTVFNTGFAKTKHMDDYFTAISHLFLRLGYSGWVILFDEAELIGRLGKKSRLNAYKNMAPFLFGGAYTGMQAVYSIFTFTASFSEDVIEAKNEFANLSQTDAVQEDRSAMEKSLNAILSAWKLQELTKDEVGEIMASLFRFYKRAYDWEPDMDINEMLSHSENHGYLLRTRIRAAVECLDQLYQYNQVGNITINPLGKIEYNENQIILDD